METCSVVLTFESVDKIRWCDYPNETSSAVLFHGTICFSIFNRTKSGAHYPERVTPILNLCHGVFTDQFICRTAFNFCFLHYNQ